MHHNQESHLGDKIRNNISINHLGRAVGCIPCLGAAGTKGILYVSELLITPGMQVPTSAFQSACQQLFIDMTLSSLCLLLRSRNRVLTRNLSPIWCLYGRRRFSFHSFLSPLLRVPMGSVPAQRPRLRTPILVANSIPSTVQLTVRLARITHSTMCLTLLLVWPTVVPPEQAHVPQSHTLEPHVI